MVARYPSKVRPGDRVAVVSASAGLPALFPRPYELGLRRIEEDFGLVPVEYPTTRAKGATPAERAADLHAAFADPDIAAVIASIGGDDQITVLSHVDSELLCANPKPFFGYSDNTNLLARLHRIGLVGYHGGSVMVEFGRPVAMHPVTADSLRAALFTSGWYELPQVSEYRDTEHPWDDPATFEREPDMQPCGGWIWHNADRVVEGSSWGGNLEIISWLLMADVAVGPVESYAGGVFFLETSQELPGAKEVYRILRNMGERGLLRQFPAALVGRAKAWFYLTPKTTEEKAAHIRDQRQAVLRAFTEYAPETMLVFDVDLGHTDPQLVIPYGGLIRVDGPARTIAVTY